MCRMSQFDPVVIMATNRPQKYYVGFSFVDSTDKISFLLSGEPYIKYLYFCFEFALIMQ